MGGIHGHEKDRGRECYLGFAYHVFVLFRFRVQGSGLVVSDTGSGILDVTLPDGSGNGRTQHGPVCRA